jgi:hypothetical protein
MSTLSLRSLAHLGLSLAAAALCSAALAAGDAGSPKLPTTPPSPMVDKTPRCLPAAVNECRQVCTTKKYDSTDKVEVAKKQNECKADCVRGC